MGRVGVDVEDMRYSDTRCKGSGRPHGEQTSVHDGALVALVMTQVFGLALLVSHQRMLWYQWVRYNGCQWSGREPSATHAVAGPRIRCGHDAH